MAREQFNARLEPDYAEAVKDFAEAKDIGKSVAARRLIVEGLRSQNLIGTEQKNRKKRTRSRTAQFLEGITFMVRMALYMLLLFGVPVILLDQFTALDLLITGTAWG